MKEKIINYIETLEAKANQTDDYFKQRNDLYIENQNKDKEIERLKQRLEESQLAYLSVDEKNRKLQEENNLLKQIIGNDKKYSYGIRMGSDKE